MYIPISDTNISSFLFITEKSDRSKYVKQVMIDNMLAWKDQIEALCNRTKQRIYFLGRLGSFGVRKLIILLSVVMSRDGYR